MREDEIYVATKNWFQKKGFIALAGQPPNGCDNIPVIEIKNPDQRAKGSKGAYKPDLVFASPAQIILIECKPAFNDGDKQKLEQIAGSPKRQEALYNEMLSRRILETTGLKSHYATNDEFLRKLRYCMTYSGSPVAMKRIASVSFSENLTGVFTPPEMKSLGCLIE